MLFQFIDFLSNIIDFCLFLVIIHKKTAVKAGRRRYLAYTLCFLSLYILMKSLHLPTAVFLILFLSCQIIYIHLISSASFTESLFWSTAFLSLVMVADEMSYFIFSIFRLEHLAALESPGALRLSAMLIYYPILLTGSYLLVRLRTPRFDMPAWLALLSCFTVFLGLSFFYMQIDLTVELSRSSLVPQHQITSSVVSCFLLIVFFLLLLFLISVSGKLYFKNRQLLLRESEIEHETKQYQAYADSFRILRGWRHDFRNQLLTISELAKNHQSESLMEYLDELLAPSENGLLSAATGNVLLDAMLNTKQSVAKEQGITITSTVYLPEILSLSQVELSSLIGNLLDNAIDACRQLDDSLSKTISLQIKPNRGNLLIAMSNPSAGRYITGPQGLLLSTKNESGHGFGLERVRTIVEEHDGYLQILPEPESFSVRIILPLPPASA